MKVFVTGGTGLVGRRLIKRLKERGDEVVLLTRRPAEAREQFKGACTVVEGDPMKAGPWQDAVAGCDGVVNLAGENIFARRWSDEFKALIRDSRIQGTENVVAAIAKAGEAKPNVLVNASAIGYYGPHGDEEITEDSPAGNDFLATVCVDWEKAAKAVEEKGVRLVVLRTGVVVEKGGGALAKMLTPFKLGVGGKVGSGQQYMAWVHNDDLAGIICLALDTKSAIGPLNGTAPKPVTNKEFSKALGGALGRPSFMPTPRFMLRFMLGEVADVITTGQRVLPKKALALGYLFNFPEIDETLRDVLK